MRVDSAGGLLWFDDDARRPIQEKIAEAAQRYRERVGYEPTVCQLNPAQASALEAGSAAGVARSRRASAQAKPVAPPVELRLVPSDLIQPHCYLITIGEGEEPKPATLPYRDEDEPRRAPVATAEKPSRSYRLARTPAKVAAVKPVARPAATRTATAPTQSAVKTPAKAPKAATARTATAETAATKTTMKPTAVAKPSAVKSAAMKTTATKAVTTASSEKTTAARRTRTLSPEPVAAAPVPVTAKPKATGRTSKKATRLPTAEQPVLMSAAPSQAAKLDAATSATTRRAPTRRTPKQSTVSPTAVFQTPTLPLVEADVPRTRRTRKHVA